jgi:hypothetical protein
MTVSIIIFIGDFVHGLIFIIIIDIQKDIRKRALRKREREASARKNE